MHFRWNQNTPTKQKIFLYALWGIGSEQPTKYLLLEVEAFAALGARVRFYLAVDVDVSHDLRSE